MAAYKTATNGVIRTRDNAFVPSDPKNADWQAYQSWLASGNTPDPEYTPAELRLKLKGNATAMYYAKISAGYNFTPAGSPTLVKNVQIDDESLAAVQAVATARANGVWAAELDPNWQGWRCSDNSFLPMTTAQFLVFAQAVMGYIEALKKTKWAHVDNLTDPSSPAYVADADVATYDVTTGWPAN